MIRVDVLSDECDLANSGLGKPLDLRKDLVHGTGNFRAAGIGHDTERAELVATLLHGDESGNAAGADGRRTWRSEMIEFVVERKFGIDGFSPALGAREQLRQPMIALRPEYEIDGWSPADDLCAFGLRDTAGDGDDDAPAFGRGGFFEAPYAGTLGIDLLGCLLADVGRVWE